jgi:hypothetical protein
MMGLVLLFGFVLLVLAAGAAPIAFLFGLVLLFLFVLVPWFLAFCVWDMLKIYSRNARLFIFLAMVIVNWEMWQAPPAPPVPQTGSPELAFQSSEMADPTQFGLKAEPLPSPRN